MAMCRCAACGSARVTRDSRSGGYSFKKGLLGSALFGWVGAVAGVNGKSETIYVCAECGASLTYCMPNETLTKIECALLDPNYDRIEWAALKKQYCNLEKGAVDRQEEERQKRVQQSEESTPNISQAEFVSIAGQVASYVHETVYEDARTCDNLPDLDTYVAFCENLKKFVECLPQFSNLIDTPSDREWNWKNMMQSHTLRWTITFYLALKHYEETGSWMPANSNAANTYFATKANLIPIATKTEVLEDKEKTQLLRRSLPSSLQAKMKPIDFSTQNFASSLPDALTYDANWCNQGKYNNKLRLLSVHYEENDAYRDNFKIIPTLTVSDGKLEVHETEYIR